MVVQVRCVLMSCLHPSGDGGEEEQGGAAPARGDPRTGEDQERTVRVRDSLSLLFVQLREQLIIRRRVVHHALALPDLFACLTHRGEDSSLRWLPLQESSSRNGLCD